MIESVLFKNVTIVSSTEINVGDVLVREGKIVAIEPSISAHAEQVVYEKGLTLMPGVIDPHVHFRDPGFTEKEDLDSGSKAAAAGGVTSFFDMPNTSPATTSCEAIAKKKTVASEKSLINYNFFIGATHTNLAELQQVENVPGIKIYVGSSTGSLLVDSIDDLKQIFEKTKHIIAVHSEDESMIQEKLALFAGSQNVLDHEKIRSAEGAIKCTRMLVDLAQTYQHPLHICHLTTQDEVELFRSLGNQSLITTEVTAQHAFTYAPDIYDQWGVKAQINPPIRHQSHQKALLKALQDGVIHCMASDHAPHLESEKALPFGQAPSGMPGVQTNLPLMLNAVYNGLFSLADIPRIMSLAPASIYNIKQKGDIKVGYDADLVLVDLEGRYTISKETMVSKAQWSIFEGMVCKGKPLATYVNGQCVYREGDFFDSIKGQEIQCGLQ